ncbi:MAG: FecR domain-containing protein [Bacteroidetes bacterium]|nr:FecR domain-containing protein [Bacteroidota bacterium]
MIDTYNEPEDLLVDESFLAWHFKLPDAEPQRWENWVSGHPDRARLVQQAILLLDTTCLGEKPLPVQQIASAEQRLLQSLPDTRKLSFYNRRLRMIAAAVLVLLGAGLIYAVVTRSRGASISTAFGEVTSRQLPDGTDVMLDANSRIRYAGDWSGGKDREVWMDGEAFFHVSKTPEHSRFIVHLTHMDVIVTGTRFNVINRHGVENVLLEEGKVILRNKKGEQLPLTPGEFVSFNKDLWQKKTVQPDSLMAWKEQKLVFNGTPLRELVTLVNDHYDVHLQLADSSIADSTISAILPNNNLEVLLQALDATAEYQVTRENGKIIIGSRHYSR